MATRISILGSTGSIGRSTLEVVRHQRERFDVVALAAHKNVARLAKQIDEFQPSRVAVVDEAAAQELQAMNLGVEVLSGPAGLEELAAAEADVALCAMVGAAGLKPILRAIDAVDRLALANKEPMVVAGRLVTDHARERGVDILPVDSEHNAIFQCLEGHKREEVHRIYLTASGGPFYGQPRADLAKVTPAQAARHPRWDMGTKISVDSATLMNKGLEVIEAMWLFDIPLAQIEVVIHPQSIVHSLVEFVDGSILAHLGVTDMRLPIQFALTWPERTPPPMERLDLKNMPALTFAEPDFGEFPCLAQAIEAATVGGTAPALLNAANEAAVEAFCRERIAFLQISEVTHEVMTRCAVQKDGTLESVLGADAEARRVAEEVIQTVSG